MLEAVATLVVLAFFILFLVGCAAAIALGAYCIIADLIDDWMRRH